LNITSCKYVSADQLAVAVTTDDRTYYVSMSGVGRLRRLIGEWVAAGGVIVDADPVPVPQPIDRADLNSVDIQIRALGMAIADIAGTPVATLRQKYRAAYNAITASGQG